MNTKKALPFVLVAITLSGCGDKPANTPGVGAGSSASVGADTKTTESLSRERKISVEDTASASIQMPAWGLLVEAARGALDEYKRTGQCPGGLGTLGTSSSDYEDMIKDGACGSFVSLASVIVESSKGGLAWPKGTGGRVAAAKKWGERMAHIAEVANVASAEILKSLPSRSLRDPEDAKEQIHMAMIDFVKKDKLNSIWNQVRTEGQFMANFSGSQSFPVQFNIDNVTYGMDPAGWHIVKNGVDWFGGGKVLGRDMTLAMQSAIATGATKSLGIGDDQGVSSEVDSRGEAGVR